MGANRRASAWTAAAWLAASPVLAQGSSSAAPSVPLLIGAGEAEARIRLGRPDIARREVGGAVWTYRRPGCVLFLYFRTTGGEPRVVGAAAGPRRRGEAAPAVEACLGAVAADKR
jgi:hypothetical protein